MKLLIGLWIAIVAVELVTLLTGCAELNPQPPMIFTGCRVSTVAQGSLIQCTDGSSSLLLNGTNGTSGSIINAVQFCPNVSPSYPSTFPEVGFCIGNQIYAVYSALDGFMTLITPGLYESNAIGSSCTFTVKPNCIISN